MSGGPWRLSRRCSAHLKERVPGSVLNEKEVTVITPTGEGDTGSGHSEMTVEHGANKEAEEGDG